MANKVFANGREISCKAGSGKSIAALPDVCFTPPQTPGTPPGVPVPYPNTGMSSDTTKGTKKVKISGKEVMLKNKSHFKKSTGNEAGSAPKKGIVTSTNRGKVYFNSWSMNVKFEGENVVRHLDVTTHNHASQAGQTPPWPFASETAAGKVDPCKKEKEATEGCNKPMAEMCPEAGKGKDAAQKDPCTKALRCRLVPYDKKEEMCCPGQTPDHLIEASAFGGGRKVVNYKSWTYNPKKAPCMCVSGHAARVSTHGVLSAKRKALLTAFAKRNGTTQMTVKQAAGIGAATAAHTFKNCSKECLEAQLLAYHKDASQKITPPAYGASATTTAAGKRGIVAAAQKLAQQLIGVIK